MAPAITVSYTPSSILRKPRDLKSTSFSVDSFSTSKPLFLSIGFVPRKLGLRRHTYLVSKTMNKSTRVSAFKDGRESHKNVQVFKQEAFMDDGFQVKFLLREMEYTLNRMSKWIVTALFGCFILWRHDAEASWFLAGSFLNSLLSVWLKRILNQERPSTLKSNPGMPSSHSQTIFFYVGFVILSCVEWVGLNGFTIATSGLVLAFGSLFSYLRVSQQLHTMSQVVVGAVLGSIFCVFWNWLWDAFVLDAFVSSLWIRIFVVLGTTGLCLGFVAYVYRHWVKDD